MPEQEKIQADGARYLAVQGGLQGRFAQSFCVLQNTVEALSVCIEHSHDPALRQQAAEILAQLRGTIAEVQRLADNAAGIAVNGARGAAFSLQPLDLPGYLADFCATANAELRARGLGARVVLGAGPAALVALGDASLLDALLCNLLSNSLQARRDATVALCCTANRRLVYRDDGPGLPPAAAALLEGGLPDACLLDQGGTGLLLVRECAAALGWRLELPCRAPLELHLVLPETPPEVLPVQLNAVRQADPIGLQSRFGRLRRELDAVLGCRPARG